MIYFDLVPEEAAIKDGYDCLHPSSHNKRAQQPGQSIRIWYRLLPADSRFRFRGTLSGRRHRMTRLVSRRQTKGRRQPSLLHCTYARRTRQRASIMMQTGNSRPPRFKGRSFLGISYLVFGNLGAAGNQGPSISACEQGSLAGAYLSIHGYAFVAEHMLFILFFYFIECYPAVLTFNIQYMQEIRVLRLFPRQC
ncbi:hypothetical protein F5I97DRAFT_1389517 [Phlebopus sp. FC_14]|nr:hypothetical protein F5I97DRAFT_1389517 [Phlebopus sp. FC_14]